MNQGETNSSLEQFDNETNIIDLIYPLYKHRKYIILFCLISMLIAGIVSLFIQRTYRTTAVLLLENEEMGAGNEFKAAFLQQYGIGGLEGAASAKADTFLAILKSKELAAEVLKRYNYFYSMDIKQGNQDLMVQGLTNSVMVSKPKTQPIISITIEGRDPIQITDLANSYAISLDKFNRLNTVTSAQRLRKYIENRLQTVNTELDEAQDHLREFQEKSRAISISKQAEATLTVLAELESQRVALDVEKAAKEKFFGRPHIEIEQLKAKMDAIQKNINHLTYSNGSAVPIENEKGKVEFYIPLTKIPGLNFNESKLLLNIKVKTGVVSMLTTQLEQTKLDEAKDMATINLLDPAKIPKTHIKPKRRLYVVMVGVFSFALAMFWIFSMEYIKKINQDQGKSTKLTEMENDFINAIHRIKQNKIWMAGNQKLKVIKQFWPLKTVDRLRKS